MKLPPAELLDRALAKREPIRAKDTDALRIVDGRGDGFDDLEIDDFAGRWLVQTRRDEAPEWLRDRCSGASAKRPGQVPIEQNTPSEFPCASGSLDDCRKELSTPVPGASQKRHYTALYWKKLGDKKPPVWIAGEQVSEPFVVSENGIRYWIDFSAGYSQGLFLDQRDNRAAVRAQASGQSVLNCFAYTCAFGVSAALGGAHTVNLDLSKHYLDWGQRNYALNNIDPVPHEFIYGDVRNWLERFARKQRRFDLIILDPPTFSRDDRGRVFTIESGLPALVAAAEKILARDGAIFCSSNQRSITPAAFQRLISSGLADARRWKITASPMPPDFCGEQYLKSCWLHHV